MSEKKRYYRTNVNLEDNNHNPYYNIRDRKKERNNVLFMVSGKYTSKEIVDRLNEQEEQIKQLKKCREELFIRERDTKNEWRELKYENKRLKTILEDQIQTILKQKRKINELTAQLKTDEGDDVCIKCKHHYLINYPESSKYYISKCEKEHEECSKEYIRFCEDFELELEGDVE